MTIRSKPAILSAAALALAVAGAAVAQVRPQAPAAQTVGDAPTAGQEAQRSAADSGAQVYRQICQACHMPNGEGGSGAATFPALAHNPRLQYPAYPITMVARGRGGMPPFADVLTPSQIAGVVTYVRTHFGNDYAAPVRAEDVQKLAGPTGPGAAH